MTGLIQKYHSYLSEAGFFPRIEDHEDISFKYQGGSFFLRVHESDPGFFHLVMPAIYAAESETFSMAVARAMNDVNHVIKAVKLVHTDAPSEVHALVETILPAEDGSVGLDVFQAVLMRGLGALQTARRRFAETLEAAK